MKIVKRILIGLLCLIGLLLLAALFVKKDYKVEREVVVNKPKGDVFAFLKYTRNQDSFNKWIMTDPLIQKSYKGTDGTVGFVYAWDSKGQAGKGEQEIKNIQEGQRVDLTVHFMKPMDGNAAVWMTTDAVAANQTTVKWGMEGSNPYPLNIMNLFVPSVLGKDLQTSLNTLKTVLEGR